MQYETINRQAAITAFHRIMQPNHQTRILRLVGDTRLGKSHLTTKIFPTIAQQDYQAHYAILDLRNPTHTVTDCLHSICSQIKMQKAFSHYQQAYEAWINRSKIIKIDKLLAICASLLIKTEDNDNDLRQRDLHLTTEFIKDLEGLDDKPLVLFFDSVDGATEYIQNWLLNIFLVHLTSIRQARGIIAGRHLPDSNGSYSTLSQTYQLLPVMDIEEYIAYCNKTRIELSEQSIKDIVKVFHFTPGLFTEGVIPIFAKQEVLYE